MPGTTSTTTTTTTETVSPSTTTTTATTTPARPTFFSKVRSRLTRRRSNSGSLPSTSSSSGIGGATDPYRKARSMDIRHGTPFLSQPALALRGVASRRTSSEHTRLSASPVAVVHPHLVAAPPPRPVRASSDVAKRPDTTKPISAPPPLLQPKLRENGTAPRKVDGLPTEMNALRALTTPPRSDSLERSKKPTAAAAPATTTALTTNASAPRLSLSTSISPSIKSNGTGEPPTSGRRASVRFEAVSADGAASPVTKRADAGSQAGEEQAKTVVAADTPTRILSSNNPFRQVALTTSPTPVSPTPTTQAHANGPPTPQGGTNNKSGESVTNDNGDQTPRTAPSGAPHAHASTDPISAHSAPFLELAPMQPFSTILPPSLSRRDEGASPGSTPTELPAPPTTTTSSPPPAVLFPRRRFQSASESAPGPSVHSIITEEPLPATPPRLSGLPPPSRALRGTKLSLTGGARLSPALTIRPPPMPILTLPPLPPSTPSEASRSAGGGGSVQRRPSAHSRLRSMPTLSMAGAGAHDQDDADHENAMLEEDEEDAPHRDRAAGESSDDEDYVSARSDLGDPEPPMTASGVGSPRVDLSALRRSSRILTGIMPGAGGGGGGVSEFGVTAATPRASRIMDYFSAKSPEKDRQQQAKPREEPLVEEASATPRPVESAAGASAAATTPAPGSAILPPLRTPTLGALRTPGLRTPTALDSGRPALYHHASRSMVDLLGPKKERLSALVGDDFHPLSSPGGPGTSTVGSAASGRAQLPAIKGKSELPSMKEGVVSPTLRRQHSLPMFNPSSPPPPYPSFGPLADRFRVVPREDEGRERLPTYTNGLRLRAVLPRKLEFSSPGVQARDRKWRRVLCELEGTVFRVYRAPPHISGVSPLTHWWEDKVGVGDIASGAPASGTGSGGPGATRDPATGRIHIPVSAPAERPSKIGDQPGEEGAQQQQGQGQQQGQETEEVSIPRERSRSRSRFGAAILHPHSRSRVSLSGSPPASQTPSSSAMTGASSRPSLSSDRTSSESSSAASKDELPEPDPKDLIRAYTMQNAESGLGSDYLKRKNVIRVRMEGEQFLLQAPDVVTVVDWIEGLQAATNISLDLDERPMPRGPLFPRRRRRRARRADGANGTTNDTNNVNGNNTNRPNGNANSTPPRS